MNDAYDGLAVGFAYKNIELAIAAALHAEKLACCRIDPGLYRGFVDPTHFAAEATLAAVKSGLSINGNVHWSERFVMTARIPLGQPLTMSGEIAMIEPHPRGSHMRSVFAYTLPDGSVPLRTERTSLRLDPGRRRVKYPRRPTYPPSKPWPNSASSPTWSRAIPPRATTASTSTRTSRRNSASARPLPAASWASAT